MRRSYLRQGAKMFDGYFETPAQIAARKRRILGTRVLPPMTWEQWQAQPEAFRRFHTWEHARKPLTIRIDEVSSAGLEYFTGKVQR
jgi:hypothetical protein